MEDQSSSSMEASFQVLKVSFMRGYDHVFLDHQNHDHYPLN